MRRFGRSLQRIGQGPTGNQTGAYRESDRGLQGIRQGGLQRIGQEPTANRTGAYRDSDKNLRGIRQEPAWNQTGADKGSVRQTEVRQQTKGQTGRQGIRLQTRGQTGRQRVRLQTRGQTADKGLHMSRDYQDLSSCFGSCGWCCSCG